MKFRIQTSLLHLLTAVFIGLKLFGTVDWTWWTVLSPSIAYFGLALVMWAIVGLVYEAARKKGLVTVHKKDSK
jgi:ATP/ADP translocase